jgi:hypothetical protein
MRRDPVDGSKRKSEGGVRCIESEGDAHNARTQQLITREERCFEARRRRGVYAKQRVGVGPGTEAAAPRLHPEEVVQEGTDEAPVQLQPRPCRSSVQRLRFQKDECNDRRAGAGGGADDS